MIESLLEAIDHILSQGKFSWGAIITALLFFNKIQRNKEFRLRDQRVERNQQRIMAKLGVEGEWATPQRTLLQMVQQSLKKLYSSSRKDTQQGNQRRKKEMMQFLRSNISKKLLALLVGVAVTSLNAKFSLQLSESDVYILFAGIITYVLGQSHIDAKRAIANGVHTVSEVAQQSIIPTVEPVEAPLMSFQELIPYINEVGTSINALSNDLKTGKPTDATKEAINAIMSIHAFLKKGA